MSAPIRKSKPIPPPQLAQRALAADVAWLKRKVADLESVAQAELTSVEGGTIDFYDEEADELRLQIGQHLDGSMGIEHVGGGIPAVPTEPDVFALSGAVVVVWDGEFEDPQSRKELDRIAIHVGETSDFAIVTEDDETDDDPTERAAIYSRRGGSAVIPLDPGQYYYVRLTAVSKSGLESATTDAIEVWATESEAVFWQDEFELTADGAQDLEVTYEPLDQSEHLYWHPGGGAGLYQREDVAWTRIDQTVSLTGEPRAPKTGDTVIVEYAYLPVPTPAFEPLMRGFVSDEEGSGSTPMTLDPVAGAAEEGDFFLLATNGATDPVDPRIVDDISPYPTILKLWWGHLTTGGGTNWDDPFTVDHATGAGQGTSAVLACVGGNATYGDHAINDPLVANSVPQPLPVIADSEFVIGVMHVLNGFAAGNTVDESGAGGYTKLGHADGVKHLIGVFWKDLDPAGANPASNFTANGSINNVGMTTVSLIGVE